MARRCAAALNATPLRTVMSVIESRLDPRDPLFVRNRDAMAALVADLRAKVALIDSGSRVEVPLAAGADNRFSATGKFLVKPGMSALLDVEVGGRPVAKLRYTLK